MQATTAAAVGSRAGFTISLLIERDSVACMNAIVWCKALLDDECGLPILNAVWSRPAADPRECVHQPKVAALISLPLLAPRCTAQSSQAIVKELEPLGLLSTVYASGR